MKSREELNELKNEYENLTKKMKELTQEEIEQVAGGIGITGILCARRFALYSDCEATREQVERWERMFECSTCHKNHYRNK